MDKLLCNMSNTSKYSSYNCLASWDSYDKIPRYGHNLLKSTVFCKERIEKIVHFASLYSYGLNNGIIHKKNLFSVERSEKKLRLMDVSI